MNDSDFESAESESIFDGDIDSGVLELELKEEVTTRRELWGWLLYDAGSVGCAAQSCKF